MAYLERPTAEPPDYADNQVTDSDEINLVPEHYDYPYEISPNISSASAVNSYSVIENTSGSSANAESLAAAEMAYSRQLGLPPVPDVYDRMILTEYVNENPDAAASSALETSYSGLESSTREPPPVPAVYDRMIQHKYVNTELDDPASSAQVTTYAGLEFSTLEPPPAPAVYDRMIQRKYVNTEPDGAASSTLEASYCGLESSTREPPPAPAVYEAMLKPDYVNVNGAATEVMSATNSEEPHSDTGISPDVSPSST